MSTQRNPWLALFALVVGFFMILLDMTIVAVANPAIMTDLGADISQVIWVTSAYLLTYAVPLLITGRLGDRSAPRTSTWPVWPCSPLPRCGAACRTASRC